MAKLLPLLKQAARALRSYAGTLHEKRSHKKTLVLTVPILKNEFWYGMEVEQGMQMPVSASSKISIDIDPVLSANQAAPLLVSSLGRYVWCESGFKLTAKNGVLYFYSSKGTPALYEGFGNLKGAYADAQRKFFPPDGNMPAPLMFRVPQYCTWIQLDTNQTQKGILAYAKSILAAGMPAGELLIDDGWQQGFGDWRFHKEKIPDPAALMRELKEMGFTVILWICPFISETTDAYQTLATAGALVKDKNGRVARRTWWNGTDAVLDFSHPAAVAWFQTECNFLMETYGVDGFKQDAGDPMYYRDSDITHGNVDANTQALLWAASAKAYAYNELRASFKAGGFGLAQRLADKSHRWGANGLGALVPNALAQGVLGYPFTCPDMIGGGQIANFRGVDPEKLDHELFVRYAQCGALMPMMQFSLDVWALPNKQTAALCLTACDLHLAYSDYMLELAEHAAKTGEPIVRYLEYEFPGEGLEQIIDAFMLGDRYLVAPVLQKGARTKTVQLPKGIWRYLDGKTYEGGQVVTVDAGLDVLPVFEKL